MLLVAIAGLALLWLWGSSPSPSAAGVVFTAHGFVSAVAGFMFIGVFAIGVGLIVLGAVLWLVQRTRDARSAR
jgi:small-conductance mechanosensitive channel